LLFLSAALFASETSIYPFHAGAGLVHFRGRRSFRSNYLAWLSLKLVHFRGRRSFRSSFSVAGLPYMVHFRG